jgi:hypothetical protein
MGSANWCLDALAALVPGFPLQGQLSNQQNLSQQPFRTMMGFALLLQGRGDSGEKVRALQLGQDYKESDSSSEQIQI